jgi:hypothetical protein
VWRIKDLNEIDAMLLAVAGTGVSDLSSPVCPELVQYAQI